MSKSVPSHLCSSCTETANCSQAPFSSSLRSKPCQCPPSLKRWTSVTSATLFWIASIKTSVGQFGISFRHAFLVRDQRRARIQQHFGHSGRTCRSGWSRKNSFGYSLATNHVYKSTVIWIWMSTSVKVQSI